MFNSTRFNNMRRNLWVAVTLSMMLVLAGCGGTSAAPLSGVDGLPTISISVSPTTSTVPTGTVQTFTATVNNTTATTVSWLVNGLVGGAFKDPTTGVTSYPSGQIDSKGNYTAPQYVPVPATVTITAASNANNTMTANATATITGAIQPGSVTISPTSASIYVNQVVALNASVSGATNPIVTYSVNDEVGGNLTNGTVALVAGSETDGLYTAPAVAPNQPVNVTASYLDPLTNLTQSASALVTVLPLPANAAAVAITPPIATVEATQTLTLTANVTGGGITGSPVSWLVNGEPNGNSTAGTIKSTSNTTATYTAPQTVPAPNAVVITATATEASYASASAIVTIATFIPPVVNVTAPSFPQGNASVVIGGTLVLDATVTNGPTNATLTWTVSQPSGCNDPGSVTDTPPGTQETYTAPSTEPVGSCDLVTVTATLEGSNPPVVGNLPVLVTAQPVVNVTLSPSAPQTDPAGGLGIAFTATVTGTTDTAVSWDVNGENGGDSIIGTIVPGIPINGMPTATYLSPATVPSSNPVEVTAVWAGDNKTSSAPTAITITPVQSNVVIQVSPTSADVMVSQTQQFSATLSGTTDDTVYWSVSGTNCGTGGCGTIFPTTTTTNGQITTYTAPATVPPVNTVTVTAKADAAPNPTSTATVTVEPNATPTIAINPDPGYTEPAGTGGNFGFTAVIQNAPNTTEVTWTMGCNSLSDGGSGEDCHDSDFDGDGPGCIALNGFSSCTGGESLGGAGNLTLEYTFPRTLGTVFTPNSCEPTQNGANGQVPMTVTMSVSGCTLTSCTATVCLTIEP
jgi:hypothetical protein